VGRGPERACQGQLDSDSDAGMTRGYWGHNWAWPGQGRQASRGYYYEVLYMISGLRYYSGRMRPVVIFIRYSTSPTRSGVPTVLVRVVGYRCLLKFRADFRGRLVTSTARALQQGGTSTDSVMHRSQEATPTPGRHITRIGQGSESMCTQQAHTAMRMSWFRTLGPGTVTLGPFSVAVSDLCKLRTFSFGKQFH
jgi:hypothetical protein